MKNAGGNYDIKPLFVLIDEIINGFYKGIIGGYSLPITFLLLTIHVQITQGIWMISRL